MYSVIHEHTAYKEMYFFFFFFFSNLDYLDFTLHVKLLVINETWDIRSDKPPESA